MPTRRRTAAQKRATLRLIALNRARARSARSPRRRARRRRNPTPVVALNPVRRRRRARRPSAAAASWAGRTLRARRRNPVRGFGDLGGFISDTMIPATVGGIGALGVDVLLGVLPLPDMLRSGPMLPVTRIAGAVGLGMVAGAVADRRTAHNVTAGAVTVVLYDTLRSLLVRAGVRVPGLAGDDLWLVEEDPAGDALLGYPSAGMQVGGVDMEPLEFDEGGFDDGLGVQFPEEDGLGVYVTGEAAPRPL